MSIILTIFNKLIVKNLVRLAGYYFYAFKLSISNILHYTAIAILAVLVGLGLAGCKKAEPTGWPTDDGKIHFLHDGRLFVCNPNFTIQKIADDSNLGVEAFVCITEKK